MSKKVRLDVLLTEKGLQESRQKAQATIMSGLVYVNGQALVRSRQTTRPSLRRLHASWP